MVKKLKKKSFYQLKISFRDILIFGPKKNTMVTIIFDSDLYDYKIGHWMRKLLYGLVHVLPLYLESGNFDGLVDYINCIEKTGQNYWRVQNFLIR